jgi:hypothetical protein
VIDPIVFQAIAEAKPEDCTPLLAALVARISQYSSPIGAGAQPTAAGQDTRSTREPEPVLLTYQEAAKLLGCSASYVESLVRQRKIPRVLLPAADKAGQSRAGRLVRLCASDLHDWVKQHRA